MTGTHMSISRITIKHNVKIKLVVVVNKRISQLALIRFFC